MIQVNNLSKSYAQRTILEKVNFVLNPGERAALIGRNGQGKSTLFRIISEMETQDEGEVVTPKNYVIGHLSQHVKITKPTALEEVESHLPENHKHDTHLAEKLLFGLGLNESMCKGPVGQLSGGYQLRVELAKVLVSNPNLLLLDEPTNYLDVVSIRWLVGYLRRFKGEVIIISHDKSFLSQCTTSTLGLRMGQIKKVSGGIDKLYEYWKTQDEHEEKIRLNQEKKTKQLQSFIDRFRYQASKASLVQSRIKALNKLEKTDQIQSLKDMGLNFRFPEMRSKQLVHVQDLSFSYPSGPNLIEDLSFYLNKGDCLAVIGKNGKGKSTLLNVLAGELKASSGVIEENSKLLKSFFGQTNIERLHPDATIFEEIQSVNTKLSTKEVKGLCGAMLFEDELSDKKISVLSGGERSRVLLGKIMAHPAHLLLLDEPTNHLDMESIEVLAQNIEVFEGATVLVTHDESLIHRLATSLVVFDGDRPFYFDSSYEDFLRKVGWATEGQIEKKEVPKLSKKQRVQERQRLIQHFSKSIKPLKLKLEALEAKVIELEADCENLENLLIEASQSGEGDKIQEFSQKIASNNTIIEDCMEQMGHTEEELSTFEEQLENELNELEG